MQSNIENNGNDIIYSFTPGENVAYYRFELGGKTVYSTQPSVRIRMAVVNLLSSIFHF